MDRYTLKLNAKRIMFTAKPSPFISGIILVVITMLISGVLNTFITSNMDELASRITSEMTNEQIFQLYAEYMSNLKFTPSQIAIILFFEAANLYISFGFLIYTYKLACGEENVRIGDMFPDILFFLKYILLSIVTSVLVILWTLLFIVPGIVASMSYSQARYFLIEHRDWSVIRCINASRSVMRGHKMDYFILILSFFGWTMITGFLAFFGIWSYPYTYLTYAGYYRELTYRGSAAAS
jgi:uncharacterized membrane protein